MAITASIIGPTFITVMLDGVTHTINGDHGNYDAIREALKAKDHARVEQLINVAKSVTNYVAGRITITGDQVFYGDMEVKGSVVNRIISMMREGFDAQPMINFLERLMQNPSKRAVDELYGFLETTSLPITEDGHFLAYKKVTNDYRDFYTGKMDNSIGRVLEMPRNQVDDNRDQTCSYGLHFCSLNYLPHYHGGDGRVVIVKIDPADVVSIPSDYNNAKGRACRYEIIGEHEGSDRERRDYFNAPVYTAQVNDVRPVAPSPKTILNPALIGYNKGRSDASNYAPYDDRDARFVGDDAARYASAYSKGFGSIAEQEATADSAEEDFDRGYDDGHARGESDADALNAYDATPPMGKSDSYGEGYRDGYGDGYCVDWYDVGADRAENDVNGNMPYNDTPPGACDDHNLYREGYANGWRDAKLARL
jgi:hypothetical protein